MSDSASEPSEHATDGRGRALVDQGRLLHLLGVEAELMVAAIDQSRLTEVVPGCPGLSLAETVRHVGSLYRTVWHWLRDGRRPSTWQREPDPGQRLADYLRSGLDPLVAELAAHEPNEPCPTWWPADSTYGFWRRRLAQETTVHRVDVQGAAAIPVDDIADEVAIDGIDEVLDLWFAHRLSVMRVTGTRDRAVGIRTLDREWVAFAGPRGTFVRRLWSASAGEAERHSTHAVVSGPPANVYLWLWGRLPNRAVRWEGDRDAIGELWALLRLATR